jgi:hypothetical protein
MLAPSFRWRGFRPCFGDLLEQIVAEVGNGSGAPLQEALNALLMELETMTDTKWKQNGWNWWYLLFVVRFLVV